jgi:hypothetical protein
MRRAFFFIVAVLSAANSFASIPRARASADASVLRISSAETRVWAFDVLAPFAQPRESGLRRALRQAYEQSCTTNASGSVCFLSVDPVLDVDRALHNPQGWNRYAYVMNNPVRYTDPTGKVIDTALDIGFIVSDISDIAGAYIAGDRPTGLQWASLGGDVVGAAVPFLTGVGKAIKLASEARKAEEVGTTVYHSVEAGQQATKYVGITNNVARRGAEHAATKQIEIKAIKGLENLSRADARAVEQTLIEMHGLGKDGGTLMNKINSISKTNPKYADSLERGYQILRDVGYIK